MAIWRISAGSHDVYAQKFIWDRADVTGMVPLANKVRAMGRIDE